MEKTKLFNRNVHYLRTAQDGIRSAIWVLDGVDLLGVTLTNKEQEQHLEAIKESLYDKIDEIEQLIKSIGGKAKK